jgi:hypothetical protein
MLSAFNLEMDFTNDYFGVKCNFGTIVNIFPTDAIGLIAFAFLALMGVIAFIFWIIYTGISLKMKTNEFHLEANFPMDMDGTNGEAVRNIVEALRSDQRTPGELQLIDHF